MPSTSVTFLYPEEGRPLEELDSDADWRFFCSGLRAWIAQTYVRLRRAGLAVARSPWPPEEEGIVVYHPDYRGPTAHGASLGRRKRTIWVAIRADRMPELSADFEIVQNGCYADDRRIFSVPHWPQAGLIPRNAACGSRIESIAFKGHQQELPPEFEGPRWRTFLRDEGMTWVADTVPYRGVEADYSTVDWADFRTVDLCLCMRPAGAWLSLLKPATKLLNAWAAGVPAIVGREYPYRELRRSELDYVEVDGVETAIAAVRYLRGHPARYRAMIENGLRRSQAYTIDRVEAAWETLLFDKIPDRASRGAFRMRRSSPAIMLLPARRLRHRLRSAAARLSLQRGGVTPLPFGGE